MYRLSICFLLVLSFSAVLIAKEQKDLSPLITASVAGERVLRVGSSAAGIAQIRLQIFSAGSDPLFDSGWKDGNVFDWQVEQLGTGAYRCVVLVKDLDGQMTRKEAVLNAEADHIAIDPGPGESTPKVTMLAHDEKSGAIVNTSGDLTFRSGDFFARKDKERMRLTAEGNLGIGTDTPQAALDVNGLIRTNQGIVFPDGTVLTVAGGQIVTRQSDGVSRPISRVIGGSETRSATTGPRRVTPQLLPPPASQFLVDSVGVHIGTTASFGLDVAGPVNFSNNLFFPASTTSGGVIYINGSTFVHGFGADNTFLGGDSGNFTMTGASNTVTGRYALGSNTSGSSNTANGNNALLANTTGQQNTAIGASVLGSNSSGCCNTAVGFAALGSSATTDSNTAIGVTALFSNTGSRNIAVGAQAGSTLTTGSDNIDIGNNGVAGESATIRIGKSPTHTRAFLAGVRGVTTGVADALSVMIDSSGQLGTISSSASVKRDIAGISDESTALMKLRPVSFFYKSDSVGIRQYGLIAEEVAEVMPELVQFSPSGEAETVRYHFLPPLLLDQLQKQEHKIEDQQKALAEQQKTIDALTERLEKLERQIVRSQ